MEAQINFTVSGQLSNGSTDDIFSNVPLFVTYLRVLLLMIVIPAIVIPALLIIHVIWKNERLHTKYYFLVVNLLINDIASTPRYLYEILLMILYLFGVTVDHSDIFYTIMVIPRMNLRFSFFLLAIDRVIGVAFPYHHRKIMTTRVVYTLIAFAWLMAAVTMFIIRVTSTILFARPFGNYLPLPSPVSSILLVLSMVIPIVLTVVSNAYLFYITVQSNKRLQQNRRLNGGEGSEINKIQRFLKALQMQAKPTASALILGGVDCGIIVLLVILFAVFQSSAISSAYTFQITYLLEWGQMLSHFFVYGIYMKEIRNCIQKYKFYQRLQRMFHLRPNQVVPQ
ncbi:olfactory receptor 8U3-like [Dysidea avara]|uniref:olfactory receptor 8U3-like n=1 Tax=Dysidea avara TaxID=196820 RepID=UPI00331D308E